MQTFEKCPICESPDLRRLKEHSFIASGPVKSSTFPLKASDTEQRLWIYFHKILQDLSPSILQAVQCRSCGFIFFNPRLTESDISIKYRTISDLQVGYGPDHQYEPSGLEERRRRVVSLLSSVAGTAFDQRKLSILDYGGAEGALLTPFIEKGHEAYLLDYVEYPPAHPKIKYLGKDLHDLAYDQRFDVILLLHTLEHVVDPVALLAALRERLKPGGCLYVEVPLGAWLEWEFLREPLTHVNFFSEQSLAKTAQRVGLHPVHMHTQWQWVTKSTNPCINMICQETPPAKAPPIVPARKQMQGFRYAWAALRVNARYYGKLILKSYLR